MSDLISRAEAIKAIKGHDERTKTDTLDDTDIGYSAGLDMAIEIINKMPSVSAERVGEWIKNEPLPSEWNYKCSICGCPSKSNNHKYCSQCGAYMWAKMKGGAE